MLDLQCRDNGTLQVGELCMDVGSRASCQETPWSAYPYCDPNLDTETRAKDLVNRMTIIEKVKALALGMSLVVYPAITCRYIHVFLRKRFTKLTLCV